MAPRMERASLAGDPPWPLFGLPRVVSISRVLVSAAQDPVPPVAQFYRPAILLLNLFDNVPFSPH
jgi:hypothetical protein